MFKTSRPVLLVLAMVAIVLLVLGLATDYGVVAWVLALLVGLYVVAALVSGRRTM